MIPDDRVDQWLRTAMAAPPPSVPAGFDRRVARAVAPRRLTPGGRLAIAAYAAGAVATVALVLPTADVSWPIAAVAALLPLAAFRAPGIRRVKSRA